MRGNIVISNLVWKFLERIGAQIVTFIVTIILARLLDPSVYGTVALITIFIDILQVFIDSGFGSALIQKKDADNIDFSTVFYFNVIICIILYLVLFICAPFIARFYNDNNLELAIRILSITLIISGLKNVQQAYVAKNMIFRKFFWATLGGSVCAAITGISLAYMGYGVWALVIQMLMNTTIDTVILWVTVKWRPRAVFSWMRLKLLFRYGWKLLVAQLITSLYNNSRQLVIGKIFSKDALAYYNQGNKIPNLIIININSSIDSVLFPTLSAVQDSTERITEMTQYAIKICSYIIMPMMMGLAVCAEPLVKIVLTEKWIPCVPYIRIFCFVYAFYPLHAANLNAIRAVGHSDIYLELEIIKVTIGTLILLLTMCYGVMAVAIGFLISSIISQWINAWPNRKLLNYGYKKQLLDISPQIVLSCAMGGVVYLIQYLKLHPMMTLAVQIPAGIFFYLFGSKIFHLTCYEYIKNILKSYKVKSHKENNHM